jgi:hypothetical protein
MKVNSPEELADKFEDILDMLAESMRKLTPVSTNSGKKWQLNPRRQIRRWALLLRR